MNQVLQDEKNANIIRGGTHNTHPEKGWQGGNPRINTSDLPHEHICQNRDQCLDQMTPHEPKATICFRRLAVGRPAWPIHTMTNFTVPDIKRNQVTICVSYLDFENDSNTIRVLFWGYGSSSGCSTLLEVNVFTGRWTTWKTDCKIPQSPSVSVSLKEIKALAGNYMLFDGDPTHPVCTYHASTDCSRL